MNREEKSLYCNICAFKNSDNATFCSKCGARLNTQPIDVRLSEEKRRNKYLIIGCVALIIMFSAAIIGVIVFRNSRNLNKVVSAVDTEFDMMKNYGGVSEDVEVGESQEDESYIYIDETDTEIVIEKGDSKATSDVETVRSTYKEVLYRCINDNIWPVIGEGSDVMREYLAGSRFAIYDINGDDVEELVISVQDPITNYYNYVVEYRTEISDIDCIFEGCDIDVYDNGLIIEYYSHNQGYGDDIWPYKLYKYDGFSKKYEYFLDVDSWSCEIHPEDYPYDIDTDNYGSVYHIGATDDKNGYYSKSYYDEWTKNTFSNANTLDVQYHNMTISEVDNVCR